MAELQADVQSGTLSDNRFKSMEYQISVGVEKPPKCKLECCSPGCSNLAISNSHTLQKNKVLKYIGNAQKKVYQTKITPFSRDKTLEEVSLKSASVFPGFCSDCEQVKFQRVEDQDVTLNKSNALTLTWRAMCFTRYRRARELQLRGQMVSKPDIYELTTKHNDPVTGFSAMLNFKNSIHAFRVADQWVKFLGRGNMNGRSDVEVFALAVPNTPFIGAGMIPFPLNFLQEPDSALAKFYKETPSLAYTTMIVENIQYFVFVVRKMDRGAMEFCKTLLNLDSYLLSSYLPQVIIGGSDTVFMATNYWDNQASPIDRHIFLHAQGMKFPQMIFPFWGQMSGVNVTQVSRL